MTAPDPLGELQRTLYGVLSTDTELGVDVHDYVPETAAWPYVAVGTGWVTPWDAHGRVGYDVAAQIDVWSRYRGMSEANRIAARIIDLLNHRRLTVGGWGYVELQLTSATAMRDPDPDVRHVAVTVRGSMSHT